MARKIVQIRGLPICCVLVLLVAASTTYADTVISTSMNMGEIRSMSLDVAGDDDSSVRNLKSYGVGRASAIIPDRSVADVPGIGLEKAFRFDDFSNMAPGFTRLPHDVVLNLSVLATTPLGVGFDNHPAMGPVFIELPAYLKNKPANSGDGEVDLKLDARQAVVIPTPLAAPMGLVGLGLILAGRRRFGR